MGIQIRSEILICPRLNAKQKGKKIQNEKNYKADTAESTLTEEPMSLNRISMDAAEK
jgi:hypothetical protein